MKESDFIIGMDMGMSCISVCRYNAVSGKPEITDISGGYGKACIPSVIQYIPDSDEWIIGEQEKQVGNEIIFDVLDEKISFDYKGKRLEMRDILSKFIVLLFEQMKNIDPNAEIKRIVFSCEPKKRESIQSAFEISKFKAEYAGKAECIIRAFGDREKFSVIDYAYSGLKLRSFEKKDDGYILTQKKDYEELSLKKLDESVNSLFTDYFIQKMNREPNEEEREKLKIFTLNHKDSVFPKKNEKEFRLYYSFCYPPFQIKADFSDIEPFILPVTNVLAELSESFGELILTGGGFEQPWARRTVGNALIHDCGAKAVIAFGACIKASEIEGEREKRDIRIFEKSVDIGIMTDKFIKLVGGKTKECTKFFISDTSTEKYIDIYYDNGKVLSRLDMSECGDIKRIELTARLEDLLYVRVKDIGFGEIFPSTGYEKEFRIKL